MALSKTLQDEGKVAGKLRVRAEVSLCLDDGPKPTEMTLHIDSGVLRGFVDQIKPKPQASEQFHKNSSYRDL